MYVHQRTDKEAKAVVERTDGTEQWFQKLRHLGTVQRVREDGKTCTKKKTTLFTNLYKGNSRKKREGQYMYCARQAMACQPVLTCSQSCPYTNSLFRAALIKIKSSISSSFRNKWEL